MLRFRHLLFVALGISAASTVSCTAIFAPRDDVQRCGSKDDCDPTGDNRYTAECRFDDANIDLDTTEVDKICVAAFAQPSCDPKNFSADFRQIYDELHESARYSPMGNACADLGGVQGCPVDPMTGVCDEGLAPNEDGVCDDGETANSPRAYNIGFADEGQDFVGQDVLDQACRSYFCDASFVCDTTQYKCVQCDKDKPFSEGGCGELYISGKPSCIYQDADTVTKANVCPAPNSDISMSNLGAC